MADRTDVRRVAFVVTDLHRGGAEAMLSELIRRRDRDAFVPHVISLGGDGSFGPALRSAGATVTTLGMRPSLSIIGAVARARAAVAAFHPHVLQGWMYHGNVAASLLARSLGGDPRVIWSIHYSLDDLSRDPPLTVALIRHGHRLVRRGRVERIVYCSRRSAGQHQALGYPASLSAVIPNAVDVQLYRSDDARRQEARRALAVPDGEPLIGMFAHYRPMKDHDTMLAALAQLARRQVPARVVMGGRGVDTSNSELARSIARHGVVDRVTLLGERNDLPMLLPGLDVAALSSAWGEAFPVFIAESMACGVPCVVTDVGDSREVVGDTGIVVPPRDPSALADGLYRLVSESRAAGRARGNAARARVMEHFEIAQYVKRYSDLYAATSGMSPQES